MPQKSNHDFKELANTFEPIGIKDMLTATRFLPYASVLEYE